MIQTYDPKLVTVVFGSNILTDFADDIISVEFTEDTYSTVVGADGRVARVRNQNMSGEATITLKQSSMSNDILSAAANADITGGGGVFPFSMQDHTGNTVCSSANAWVKKIPAVKRSKDMQNMEWVLSLDRVQVSVGGIPLI